MKNLIMLLLLVTYNSSYCQCELKTTAITVFKDATVFVEKEGNCESDQKAIEIEMPYLNIFSQRQNYNNSKSYVKNNIILGTIEIETPENKIISKQSTKTIKNDVPIQSISQIFQKNIGKKVKVNLKGSNTNIEGEIFSVENSIRRNGVNLQGETKTIMLKQKDNWKFINLSEIDHFEFKDTPELYNESTEQKLYLNLEKDNQNQDVKLSYLRKGITWTPSYFISLNSDKKLKISLNANVLNDVEALSNVDLNLAVGIPVFQYASVSAPLVSDDKVVDFINIVNNNSSNPYPEMRNAITAQRGAFMNIARPESYGNNSYPSSNLEDDDDIFLYQLKGVSMNIGDRLNVGITEFETDYEDVFTVDLQPNDYFISNSSRNKEKENPTNVWHAIKFRNYAEVPLTTGTVFFKKYKPTTNSFMPISQEKLNYTPVGESCVVKMAVSPNIIIKESEKEISRDRDPNISRGYLIKVKGEIEVVNLKNERINMIVNRDIRAIQLSDSTEEWEVMQTYRRLFEGNQTNKVQWNLEIEANAKKTISYEYEVHIQ